jgi:hypothetical protein
MNPAQGTSYPEPKTPDKIRFWLGGSVPLAFDAWARDRIRSRWFPLRRMAPAAATAVMWIALNSISGRGLGYPLLTVALPLLLALVGVYVFRDRMRRRELRRYGAPGVD